MSRINARLEPEYMEKLELLKTQQSKTVTQVLKEAIDEYYASHASAFALQKEALLNSGFVGCIEGERDFSETYKAHLTDTLGNKHDYR